MRMWNVNPKVMCRQHLLGEHLEMHMFLGCIKKGMNLDGYIRKGLVEPHNVAKRHNELKIEMLRRRYIHKSNLSILDMFFAYSYKFGKVNIKNSLKELSKRCEECRRLQNGKIRSC